MKKIDKKIVKKFEKKNELNEKKWVDKKKPWVHC
jgi:hypothetical protein